MDGVMMRDVMDGYLESHLEVHMRQRYTRRNSMTARVVTGMLLLSVAACRRQTPGNGETSDDAAQRARSAPGVVDIITGKAAVDAGERAKALIRESSEQRDRQLNESLEW